MKYKIGFLFVGLIICFLLIVPSLALTADEYFEFASSKYLEGNTKAALNDLNRALKLEPDHDGASALKGIILQERATESVPLEKVLSSPPIVKEKTPPKKKALAKKRKAAPPIIIERIVEKIIEKRVLVPPVTAAKVEKMDDVQFSAGVFAAVLIPLLLILLYKIIKALVDAKFVRCRECGTWSRKDNEFCKKCNIRIKAAEFTPEQKLWLSKFGWKKSPFSLNVMTDTYAGNKKELSIIMEKLNTLSGHVLILGGLGSGKTTLLQWLERHLRNKFETIYLVRPPATPEEIIDLISATISKKANHTRRYSVYEFRNICRKHNRNILLLLDETHELNEKLEQFIRILGDLHNVFFVMAGLPQTRELLKHDLPALFDRIVESLMLNALSREETKELIKKRIENASGIGFGPFTAAAIDKIHDLGYGIPRRILKICDWIVTVAVRQNKISIDAPDVVAYDEEMKHMKPHHIEKHESAAPENKESK